MLALQKIAEREHLWHTLDMKHRDATTVLGTKAFAAITAVEGLQLNAESKNRLTSLKASGLNNDERRAQILGVYKSGR